MTFSRTIKIKPMPKPRPRAARIGGFIRMYTPKTAEKYEKAIAAACGRAGEEWNNRKPLSVSLKFGFARPKSRKGGVAFHTMRPDVDNLAKAVLDALQRTECGLLTDDCQVSNLAATKIELPTGEASFVEILIESLDQ